MSNTIDSDSSFKEWTKLLTENPINYKKLGIILAGIHGILDSNIKKHWDHKVKLTLEHIKGIIDNNELNFDGENGDRDDFKYLIEKLVECVIIKEDCCNQNVILLIIILCKLLMHQNDAYVQIAKSALISSNFCMYVLYRMKHLQKSESNNWFTAALFIISALNVSNIQLNTSEFVFYLECCIQLIESIIKNDNQMTKLIHNTLEDKFGYECASIKIIQYFGGLIQQNENILARVKSLFQHKYNETSLLMQERIKKQNDEISVSLTTILNRLNSYEFSNEQQQESIFNDAISLSSNYCDIAIQNYRW